MKTPAGNPAPSWSQPCRLTMRLSKRQRLTSRLRCPGSDPVSQIMDPTALPRARPGLPFKAASTETAASGKVVPRLTMVAPTSRRGKPHRREMIDRRSSTRRSAPLPRSIDEKTDDQQQDGQRLAGNRSGVSMLPQISGPAMRRKFSQPGRYLQGRTRNRHSSFRIGHRSVDIVDIDPFFTEFGCDGWPVHRAGFPARWQSPA